MRHPLLKRGMDVVCGTILLILFAPVMLVAALAILLTSGPPVLFRQSRPGRDGVPFTLWKFRSMRPARPNEEYWTTDDLRLTAVGRFLRRTSMDELPQLMQVVSGKMSLVGPRPLLLEYLPRYSDRHSRRHEVRPGITGLAQINGRSALTLREFLDFDVEYVETWSLALDVKILLRTLLIPFGPGYIPGRQLAERDDVHLMYPPLERVE